MVQFNLKHVAIHLLLLVNIKVVISCQNNKETACTGSCKWNFVGDCCYEKNGENCYVSNKAFITEQPTIDMSKPIGIPSPGNNEAQSGTIKQIPMENNAAPQFVPTSEGMGLMNNLPAGDGKMASPQSQGVFSPGSTRLRRR